MTLMSNPSPIPFTVRMAYWDMKAAERRAADNPNNEYDKWNLEVARKEHRAAVRESLRLVRGGRS